MLNRVQKIPGSRYSTLYPKTAISEGKGNFKTSTVTAIAVPNLRMNTKSKHFPDPEGSAKELQSLQKYAEKVKPIYENYHKNKIEINFSSNKTDLGKLVEKQTKEKQDTVPVNKKIR